MLYHVGMNKHIRSTGISAHGYAASSFVVEFDGHAGVASYVGYFRSKRCEPSWPTAWRCSRQRFASHRVQAQRSTEAHARSQSAPHRASPRLAVCKEPACASRSPLQAPRGRESPRAQAVPADTRSPRTRAPQKMLKTGVTHVTVSASERLSKWDRRSSKEICDQHSKGG